MKKDVVCGMEVRDDTQYTTLHGGRKMFFCSRDCQQKFLHNPEQYLKEAGPETGGKKAA